MRCQKCGKTFYPETVPTSCPACLSTDVVAMTPLEDPYREVGMSQPQLRDRPTPRMQTPPERDLTPQERRQEFTARHGATGGTLESRACCTIGTNVYPSGAEATGIRFCPEHNAAGIMRSLLRDLHDDIANAAVELHRMHARIDQLLGEIRQDEDDVRKGA